MYWVCAMSNTNWCGKTEIAASFSKLYAKAKTKFIKVEATLQINRKLRSRLVIQRLLMLGPQPFIRDLT